MKEAFPAWVAKEISGAKWGMDVEWQGSGYILEINEKTRQIDVQFYERMPAGRYIATLDLPGDLRVGDLQKAVVYMMKVRIFSAPLSPQVSEFLAKEYSTKIEKLYRFEAVSLEEVS